MKQKITKYMVGAEARMFWQRVSFSGMRFFYVLFFVLGGFCWYAQIFGQASVLVSPFQFLLNFLNLFPIFGRPNSFQLQFQTGRVVLCAPQDYVSCSDA